MARKRKRAPSAWRVERQLIGYVYEYPDITRSELAKRLGQSPAAISLIIRRLITNGWLRESGRAASLGGRRPVQLRLSTGRAFIVGLNISPSGVQSVVMDADGSIVYQMREEPFPREERAASLKHILKTAQNAIKKSGINSERLLGVGLSVSGVIYSDTGVARVTPGLFNYEPVDLIREFSETFKDKLIAVDNSARSRLSYEVYNSPSLRDQTVLLMELNFNVGGALSIEGRAYHGADGASLDLTQIPVRTFNGPIMPLEAVASEPAIIQRICNALLSGYPSLLRDVIKDDENPTLKQIARASQAGDQLCFKTLCEVADAVGEAVSLLGNILRPKAILFSGDVVESGALMLDNIKRQARIGMVPDVFENVRIGISESDEYSAAMGAAHHVLRQWLTELGENKDNAIAGG